jgi:hypothetical protein
MKLLSTINTGVLIYGSLYPGLVKPAISKWLGKVNVKVPNFGTFTALPESIHLRIYFPNASQMTLESSESIFSFGFPTTFAL